MMAALPLFRQCVRLTRRRQDELEAARQLADQLRPRLKRFKDDAGSYRAAGDLLQVSHTIVMDVVKDKKLPLLETLQRIERNMDVPRGTATVRVSRQRGNGFSAGVAFALDRIRTTLLGIEAEALGVSGKSRVVVDGLAANGSSRDGLATEGEDFLDQRPKHPGGSDEEKSG